MSSSQSILILIRRLYGHISVQRRSQFGLLLFLMMLASFAEILSIGAVLPFLGALTVPTQVFEHAAAQPFIQLLEITEPEQLLFPLTVSFALAAILAGALRLLLLWTSTRLSYRTGADISINIYRRTLYQPYSIHVARNSSEIINGIANKTGSVIHLLMMFLNLIGSTVMILSILSALFLIDPSMALLTFGGFGLIYLLILSFTRNRLRNNSNLIAQESTQVIKSLQEGLGGIRDILIDGSQSVYCDIYRRADRTLRYAQASSAFIGGSPRYAIEALGMVLIASIAYFMGQQPNGLSQVIPMLGALALGAQRLLPVLQQAYASWTGIQSGRVSMLDALELLDQELPEYVENPTTEYLTYQNLITLNGVSFRYNLEASWVLKNINFSITKGSRVGFVGKTGSGKSTLLDIIMGLLSPTEGTLEIDGLPITMDNHRAWQSHISHVPQAIFLADSTIEENIAFGIPKNKIDHSRIIEAASQAQIADIIDTWPKKYKTIVGERGIRLSGGQRQRIGIARALYKQSDVIIFDEATSALDNDTESAVMQAIDSLNKDVTVLIIAHRLTTLKNCDVIVELDDTGINNIGTYHKIQTKFQ